jgi:hypothetical protein
MRMARLSPQTPWLDARTRQTSRAGAVLAYTVSAARQPPFASFEATRTIQQRRPPVLEKPAHRIRQKIRRPRRDPKCASNCLQDSTGTGVSTGPRDAIPTNPATSVRIAAIAGARASTRS